MTTKTECEVCGSKNNLAKFHNGSSYCFTPDCDYNKGKEKPKYDDKDFLDVHNIVAIPDRKISSNICAKFEYYSNESLGDKPVHIANLYDKHGKLTSQRVRVLNTSPKKFHWIEANDNALMFGQHLYEPTKHTSLIVTEGEIDALSIAEAYNGNQPVVSITNGVSSAVKQLTKHITWLEQFKSVIIFLDQDEAGQTAVKQLSTALSRINVQYVTTSLGKDANEILVNHGAIKLKNLMESYLDARPEGIVLGDEVDTGSLSVADEPGIMTPYPVCNEILKGIKHGRLYMLGAGTGIGKSTFMKELSYHMMITQPHIKIANIFLEETRKDTMQSYIAMHNNIPKHLLSDSPSILGKEKIDRTYKDLLNRDTLMFTNSAFELDAEKLFNILDWLAVSQKYDIIMLDHISIIVSGSKASKEGERKDIDTLMHKLRGLINKSGVTIIAASHLVDPDGGKGFDQGGKVRLSYFRGSRSIVQLADVVLGLERNTEAESEQSRATLRVLKNRITGKLGTLDELIYMETTGRLTTKSAMFGE